MQNGVVTVATEVDHIVPLCHGGVDDEGNVQSLCAKCHREKTNADMGYRRRKKFGADGFPIEEGGR